MPATHVRQAYFLLYFVEFQLDEIFFWEIKIIQNQKHFEHCSLLQ